MSNPTKEELFNYARHKVGEINRSEEQKYIHRNIYRQFVGTPISDGVATTYEDVDKLIEESISTNPKSIEEQIYDQLAIEQKELDKEFNEWYAQLTEEQIELVKKGVHYSRNCGYETINKIKL
jgi:hypothetical protein